MATTLDPYRDSDLTELGYETLPGRGVPAPLPDATDRYRHAAGLVAAVADLALTAERRHHDDNEDSRFGLEEQRDLFTQAADLLEDASAAVGVEVGFSFAEADDEPGDGDQVAVWVSVWAADEDQTLGTADRELVWLGEHPADSSPTDYPRVVFLHDISPRSCAAALLCALAALLDAVADEL